MNFAQQAPTPTTSSNQHRGVLSRPNIVIKSDKVVLEGGGLFEEGQSYIIRDRHGNSRMMIWKEGKFYPSPAGRVRSAPEGSYNGTGQGWTTSSRIGIDNGTDQVLHHSQADRNSVSDGIDQTCGAILTQQSQRPTHPHMNNWHNQANMNIARQAPTPSTSSHQYNGVLSNPNSVIKSNKVVLEGGGQFEEGQSYIIRDRQGNSRMMIWKEGKFYPSPAGSVRSAQGDNGTGQGWTTSSRSGIDNGTDQVIQPSQTDRNSASDGIDQTCGASLTQQSQRSTNHHVDNWRHHANMNFAQQAPTPSTSSNQHNGVLSRPNSVIKSDKVVLEGGGQFEEGQTYIIRDRHGNSRMMIWKEGKLYPSPAGRVRNGNVTVSAGQAIRCVEAVNNDDTAPSRNASAASQRSLIEENERLRDMHECKVCMDQPVDTTLLPCGHLVLCSSCAPGLILCPICRLSIQGTVRTYLS